MTHKNMFTPTPELMQEWLTKWKNKRATVPYDEFFATQAAQWGADQELKACCDWLNFHSAAAYASDLRTARRPKRPKLKQQALALINHDPENQPFLSEEGITIIRHALESLPD